MAKYGDWSEQKLQRYLKEGRGSGTGREYIPWLNINDFPSRGRSHRVYGWTTNRIHYLMSDLQLRFWYLCDFGDVVVDIREHYPLLSIEALMEEQDLRFDLFKDITTNEPYVLTTNFLLTVLDEKGDEKLVAVNVKNTTDLERKRTVENFEIERRFYERNGIEFKIVTQKEISKQFAKNVEWIHQTRNQYESNGYCKEDIESISRIVFKELLSNNLKIESVLNQIDEDYNFDVGTALYVFKYLIATKQIRLDMYKPISLKKRAHDVIEFAGSTEWGGDSLVAAK